MGEKREEVERPDTQLPENSASWESFLPANISPTNTSHTHRAKYLPHQHTTHTHSSSKIDFTEPYIHTQSSSEIDFTGPYYKTLHFILETVIPADTQNTDL